MNTELSKLPDDGELPTWWTNKVAIAVDMLSNSVSNSAPLITLPESPLGRLSLASKSVVLV